MLIISELTTRSKLGCELILQACLGPRKDALMLRGIISGIALEYFVKFDAVFCFPCRNFESKLEEAFEECVVNCESTFTTDGYRY